MKTRPARLADTEIWTEMRQDLWPDALASELAEEATAFFTGQGPLREVLICESNAGEPIGMIELSLRSHADGCRSSPVPFVEGWYVMAGHRRKGAGSLLMGAAVAWAREAGFTEIASDTQLDNDAGRCAHARSGFEEIERAVHFRMDLRPARFP
jgi:aminoglycoside 6'-N-acetyltransferase I